MLPDATLWHYVPHGFSVIELIKGDENSLVMRRSGVQIPEAAPKKMAHFVREMGL